MSSQDNATRWMLRIVTGATLALGWLFILWQNKFNITVPVVVIALGYLAVVAGIASLWRVGAAAVAPEDDSPGAWSRPIGARGELEKEKKTLLKAIKEAEFDQAMGKLSQQDADNLIQTYRARAIEVIKELDRLDTGAAGSTREQIQREVQARLAVDSKAKKDKKKPAKADEAKQAEVAKQAEQAKQAEPAKQAEQAKQAEEPAAPADPPPVTEPAVESKQDNTEATS